MAGQGDTDRTKAGIRVRDEMIDARADRTINLIVGAPPPTTGGATGGGSGDNKRFVFTDLSELDELIKRLSALRARVRARGFDLDAAGQALVPPAHDIASRAQATAAQRSLTLAQVHNSSMGTEIDRYLEKLRQARAQTVDTDDTNAHELNHAGGG